MSGLGIATLANISPSATSVAWAQVVSNINIPDGSLEQALAILARQTGASIGMSGRLPHRRVKALTGRFSVAQALGFLLKGSGLTAVEVGPNIWRLVVAPHPPKLRPSSDRSTPVRSAVPRRVRPAPEPAQPSPAEIIVTAAKRTDSLMTTPIDSSTISGIALGRYSSVPTTADVAIQGTGLTLSNVGPGRNRAYLRGVGDSPFNGQTQSTVAMLIDDARVTFNAPDPDLRLVDVDRVEVLKGPQGPLYGTGAIGGVYRIVTTKPQLDAIGASLSASGEALAHGGTGLNGSAMLNLPIKRDALGLRLVAYGALEPGWIDNGRNDGHNSNSTQLRGGRLALRWRPSTDWTVDLAGTLQMLHVNDSQYVTGVSTRRRAGIVAEPHDNDFTNSRFSIAGRLGNVAVFAATSWTKHEVDSVFDATQAGPGLGLSGLLLFDDDRLYHVFNQEVRASGRAGRFRWMVGGSYLSAATRVGTTLGSQNGTSLRIGQLNEDAQEYAAFTELGLALSSTWTVDAGFRLFSAQIHDEKADGTNTASLRLTRRGVSPSLAIGFTPNDKSYYYIRAASAFRPAGLGLFAPSTASDFASDVLSSAELGGRWFGADRKVSGQVVVYGSRWRDIQSDYLLPSGLVATRNSGRGLIFGIEGNLTWRLGGGWSVTGGGTIQHAQLERVAAGLLVAPDRQLPVVPSYQANTEFIKAFNLMGWDAELSGRLTYVGATRLSLDPGLDRRIGSHIGVDLSGSARRGPWRLGIGLTNLLDSRADTFAFGNPFTIRQISQHVPMRPRSISLQVGWTLH